MKTSLLLLLAASPAAGCAFAESAGQLPIGDPDIPLIQQQFLWPSVDELTGISDQTLSAIPGFPKSLNGGTFAHLQGSMAIAGKCSEVADLDEGLNEQINYVHVAITSCTGDPRCDDICEGKPYGMSFEAEVNLVLIGEEQAKQIKEQLKDFSEVKSTAIAQMRLQIGELQFFQKVDGTTENLNHLLGDFSLVLANDDGEEVLIVKHEYLASISPETPQRFDIDSGNPVTQKLKDAIIQGQPTSLSVVLSMAIPQENLYEMGFEGGGVNLQVQPEAVISIVEVAKSKL